jgi:hypothetical protein
LSSEYLLATSKEYVVDAESIPMRANIFFLLCTVSLVPSQNYFCNAWVAPVEVS